jgi:hypothetical protein
VKPISTMPLYTFPDEADNYKSCAPPPYTAQSNYDVDLEKGSSSEVRKERKSANVCSMSLVVRLIAFRDPDRVRPNTGHMRGIPTLRGKERRSYLSCSKYIIFPTTLLFFSISVRQIHQWSSALITVSGPPSALVISGPPALISISGSSSALPSPSVLLSALSSPPASPSTQSPLILSYLQCRQWAKKGRSGFRFLQMLLGTFGSLELYTPLSLRLRGLYFI